MPFTLRLRSTLGRNRAAEGDDVLEAKRALSMLGLYEPPKHGMTPYPDDRLFEGLRAFQEAEGLKPDGVAKPGGPTEQNMNKYLEGLTRGTNLLDVGGAGGADRAEGKVHLAAAPAVPIAGLAIPPLIGLWQWWQSLSDEQRQGLLLREGSGRQPGDDEEENKEKCYQRWEDENARCPKWGPKWKNGCEVRAADRRGMCHKYGFPLPYSPAEWSKADMEVWRRPD